MYDRNLINTTKDILYAAGERFGDAPFMRRRVKKEMVDRSFNELKHDACAVGAWLEAEFDHKIHAAIFGSTSFEFVVSWFGLTTSGSAAVPLNAANKPSDLADEINRSDSELVFLDELREEAVEELKKLCPQVRYFVHMHRPYDGTLYLGDIIAEYCGKEPVSEIDPDQLAAIIYTSGTTGRSKGVMLSHRNSVDNATCIADGGNPGDKRMTVLPVHHVFAFTCDIMCTLWYGRTLCVNDSLMRIPKNLKAFQPVETTFVPMIAASILSKMQLAAKTNPDKLAIGRDMFGEEFSILYVGGAYLSPEIIDGYKEFGIDVAQGYGMTECTARISTGVRNCPYPESVGKIIPGCEVKIVDGEIWAKGPSVMMGYYKDPEETAKTLTEDGWLKTGDLGYVKDGYVFISGRKKNLIILANGENVSPEELENKFAMSEPVKEIVVFEKDHVITAEIYPNPDYEFTDIEAEIQAEIDKVNETLPLPKQIHGFILRDTEFEKTASKKIKRDYNR
ncbi:MAG: AMP-binding protein [Candidatus Ornithomonoglobus sp.]